MDDRKYNKNRWWIYTSKIKIMAFLQFKNVGIKAMSACVPKNISSNYDLGYLIPEDEIEKTINSIGIKEKRFVDSNVCSSDLCVKAAEKLFEDNNIDRSSIDMVLFLSQTADYRIPATAPIIQHRLGLPQTTASLDLNLGCSGFVYGLSTAFSYASIEGIDRVLLLVGETFSKIVNPKDKVNAPLYGDAGTATLIEKENKSSSYFLLNSDGKGENAVKIPSGGYRNPVKVDDLEERLREEGNIRSNLDVYMNGMDVFNFAIRVVPRGVKEIMKKVDLSVEAIDYLVFHQANKFMTDFFVKRLKINDSKVPYCIGKYGNTSAASIPLTIVSELFDTDISNNKIIMSGFGAGLSWGTALVIPRDLSISKIIEY